MKTYSFNLDVHLKAGSLEDALAMFYSTINHPRMINWDYIVNTTEEDGEEVSNERLGEVGY